MNKINIICVDDQRDVLDSVVRDLKPLSDHFTIEECESVAECWELLDEMDANGELVGLLISDQVMPGESGVSLLSDLSKDRRFKHTRKVLLTGLATQSDTIQAINAAKIDHYLEKPWNTAELVRICRQLMTEYILEQGLDYEEIMSALDQNTLYQHLQN